MLLWYRYSSQPLKVLAVIIMLKFMIGCWNAPVPLSNLNLNSYALPRLEAEHSGHEHHRFEMNLTKLRVV